MIQASETGGNIGTIGGYIEDRYISCLFLGVQGLWLGCVVSVLFPLQRVVFEKNVPNFRTLAIGCYREVFPAKNLLRNLHYLDWKKCSLLGGPSSGSNNFAVKALFCHMQPGSARYHGHLSSWHFLNPTAPRATARCTQLSTRDFCFPPGARFTCEHFEGCLKSKMLSPMTSYEILQQLNLQAEFSLET